MSAPINNFSEYRARIDRVAGILKDNFHLFLEWNIIKKPEDIKDWLSEESAEMIVAMQHFYRGRVGEAEVTEELVDTMICMIQLAIAVGSKDFAGMLQKKLDKAKLRMENAKG